MQETEPVGKRMVCAMRLEVRETGFMKQNVQERLTLTVETQDAIKVEWLYCIKRKWEATNRQCAMQSKGMWLTGFPQRMARDGVRM